MAHSQKTKKKNPAQTSFPCSSLQYFQPIAAKWPAVELVSFSFTSPSCHTSSLKRDWLLCEFSPWWFSQSKELSQYSCKVFLSLIVDFLLVLLLFFRHVRKLRCSQVLLSKSQWKVWTEKFKFQIRLWRIFRRNDCTHMHHRVLSWYMRDHEKIFSLSSTVCCDLCACVLVCVQMHV